MKITIPSLLAIGLAPLAFAQTSSPSASGGSPSAAAATSATTSTSTAARSDIYHVHFANAATGKAQDLAELLKKQDPTAPMPGHFIVLRHEDGDSWDYCVVEHLGTKATVDANRPAAPPAQAAAYAAHTDTFAAGPAWSEFAKQLGIDDASKTGTGAAFVVSMYRTASGQREALDKFLNEPPDRTTDSSAGRVTLQHLEGAAWNFVSIQRWNSWADYAKDNVASIAQMGRNQQGGWFKLRSLISFHTDTLCDRIAP
ncbi:MAG: hypothetical protein ACJ8KU_09905 [Chthoniobacterales bacterium]